MKVTKLISVLAAAALLTGLSACNKKSADGAKKNWHRKNRSARSVGRR